MRININKWDVLVVNRNWLVLGLNSIKKSLIAIHSLSSDNVFAALPFNIEYEYLGDEKWDFDNPINIEPVQLDVWLGLPIRPYDSYLLTSKQKVRIPTVIMAQNCDKTHLRKMKLSTRSILERDNYTCQYTNRQLPRSKLNIDHVISKDEWKRLGLVGSPDVWTNMVACDKDINSNKGNKNNKEAGLTLIRVPREPLPLPASSLIREIRFNDWKIFLHK